MIEKIALLIVLLAVTGCQPRRPDFMTRVREDCAAGDQWACDLIDALQRRKSSGLPARGLPAQHGREGYQAAGLPSSAARQLRIDG
jgi:hypothetical protein